MTDGFTMEFREEKKENTDTSQDNDSMIEALSPVPHIQPRKLLFTSPMHDEQNDENKNKMTKGKADVSPPYRKVRALTLFDTPATPKTILKKCSKFTNHLSSAVSATSSPVVDPWKFAAAGRSSLPLFNRTLENVGIKSANVNPFTPDSLLNNKKRCRVHFNKESKSNGSFQSFLNSENCDNLKNLDPDAEADAEIFHQAPKRLALQDTNISRYQKEFIQISLIGIGEFGLVYQCLNRLDGCVYAIKKSIKPVAGSSFEKRALNEVWAHAVLGKHDNVVRYYSAWAEDNHMLIQNEYCNGGSLQSFLQKRVLVESELKILLLHVAEGLRYIHSNDLVHMDLKAGNIFLTKEPSIHHKINAQQMTVDEDDGMRSIYEELSSSEFIITYKIGDLGHVTSVHEAYVEEGDCRYLSVEILQEDFTDLFKADIFSLGITLYEAAGGGPLPKNGPEWHNLRNGNVPYLPTLSKEFNDLIKLMTHPNPEMRPSSSSIFNHPILSSLESKSKSELSQELVIEKRKNELLLRKLREAKKQLKECEENSEAQSRSIRKSLRCTAHRCLRSHAIGGHTRQCSMLKKENLRDRNKNTVTY